MKPYTDPGRRKFLKRGMQTAAGVFALGAGSWWMAKRHQNLYRLHSVEPMMATSVSVTVLAHDLDHGRSATRAAMREMAATAAKLNRFDSSGAVATLNRTGVLERPSAALLDVLGSARHYSEVSEGAFDVTVLPVLEYYLKQELPVNPARLDRAAIQERDQQVDYRHLAFDANKVRLARPGMAITLDGIGKGYVVDQGIRTLRKHGIEDAIIDAGGEIRAINKSSAKPYWTVGIADPRDTRRMCALVPLRNHALSTSGNYEVFFSTDHRLFHIINPHTGYSPDQYASVTVLAPHSVDADALSVALFSLPREDIKELMHRESKEWFITSWDGQRHWHSPGFPLMKDGSRTA